MKSRSSSVYTRKYRESHREEIREYNRTYQSIRRGQASQLREQILIYYGKQCVRCKFADIRALQIDHINGGGSQHRRRERVLYRYYQSILANLDQYQLLCANCNWIKRAEQRECNPV